MVESVTTEEAAVVARLTEDVDLPKGGSFERRKSAKSRVAEGLEIASFAVRRRVVAEEEGTLMSRSNSSSSSIFEPFFECED